MATVEATEDAGPVTWRAFGEAASQWARDGRRATQVVVHPATWAVMQSELPAMYPLDRIRTGARFGLDYPHPIVDGPLGRLLVIVDRNMAEGGFLFLDGVPLVFRREYLGEWVPDASDDSPPADALTVEVGATPDHVDKVIHALEDWSDATEREVILDLIEQLTGRREFQEGVRFAPELTITASGDNVDYDPARRGVHHEGGGDG